MKINRIDHVSINVNNLAEAKAFFLELGLEVHAEWELDGKQLDKIVGLNDVKTACVGMGMPGGQTWIELVKFCTQSDEKDLELPSANTLGIRHICFAVEDIDAVVAKLKKRGTEIFSEVQQYKETYKLCYVRGPEGIILELAEKLG
ncbi:VOC family protein [Psychrobacillus psychrodurans]|uniref:VOC family protein n=1 Tax=Psychrobacillus psychrodurans TaxID=126157 RepID=UPI0008EF6C90|nr:VOC family protein [Psychrobacillus psychrodurans]MCK1998217.1 VOC family protein [Psychrobacillus psychrodurans]MCZ8542184.1 VOC family protein [Psychrobacillus psychrodurans]SFN18859.1 Catechol 2,3-dioxygenase [Psychrobacillus psychrodurans]